MVLPGHLPSSGIDIKVGTSTRTKINLLLDTRRTLSTWIFSNDLSDKFYTLKVANRKQSKPINFPRYSML